MIRSRWWTALVLSALLASACLGGSSVPSSRSSPRGGTLRLALPADVAAQFDPQKAYDFPAWELFRCCLLRTLMSYKGAAADRGGAEPKPDLATSDPIVSRDGLTWTFRIRSGVHYAPPLRDIQVTAPDFVRALEREADPHVTSGSGGPTSGYPSYYSPIQGFDRYRSGRASSISGLQTPNAHTLVIRLTQPTPDLAYRLAAPAAAPIPPKPGDAAAPYGVATGHDGGYGRFLVASGPYMFQGAGTLRPAFPSGNQAPVAGYRPKHGFSLVRNPSWSRATDQLRTASVDRIRARVEADPFRIASQVDRGLEDLMFSIQPAPLEQVTRYERDPKLRGRVLQVEGNAIFYMFMNLAVPPFDDLHVRKAVAYVLNKRRGVETLNKHGEGAARWEVATHLALDALENGLLLNYDTYRSRAEAGSLKLARGEMAQSGDDADHDGRCDIAACRHVFAVNSSLYPPGSVAPRFGGDLRKIGIHIQVRTIHPGIPESTFARRGGAALALDAGWGIDYPSGAQLFPPLFGSNGIGMKGQGCCDYSLLGATESQLRRWRYSVKHVPTVDPRIRQCAFVYGIDDAPCWAHLDKYLMEEIVPAVPYMKGTNSFVVSARVSKVRPDAATLMPALDQIALKPGSS